MAKKSNLKRGKSVHPVHLGDLIVALKKELRDAAKQSKGDKLFVVGEVTLDVGVRFNRTATFGASVGITAQVVDSTEASHRLAIKLMPAGPEELEKILLNDENSPLVQGPGAAKGSNKD